MYFSLPPVLGFQKRLGDFSHLLLENRQEVIRPALAEDRLREYRAIFDWSAERNRHGKGSRVHKRIERSGPARFNPKSGSKHFFDMLRRFKPEDYDFREYYSRTRAASDVAKVQRMDQVLERLTLPLSPDLTEPMQPEELRYDRSANAYGLDATNAMQGNTNNPQMVYSHPAPLIQLSFAFGRVLVELNIDACPTVVWHLVYTCSMNLHKSFEVCGCQDASRLEISMTLSKQFVPVALETFSYELQQQLQHNCSEWLLSVDKDVFANVSVSGQMLFALSLGHWSALQQCGQRVACGRVIVGEHVLEDLTLRYAWLSRLPINVLTCGSFLREPLPRWSSCDN